MTDFESAKALFLEGLDLLEGERYALAEEKFAEANGLVPDRVSVLTNLSAALIKQERFKEAKIHAERAVKLDANNIQAWLNVCSCLEAEGNLIEALAVSDKLISLDSSSADAWFCRAITLNKLNRADEALIDIDKALVLQPDHSEAWNARGMVLQKLKRFTEALSCHERAVTLKPNASEAWLNRGAVQLEMKEYEAAVKSIRQLLTLKPDFKFAKGILAYAKMLCCDWTDFEALVAELNNDVRTGHLSAEPFAYQAISLSEQDLKRCAQLYATEKFPAATAPLWNGDPYANGKIRIGYLSGEFRHQATSILMVELFERHDKKRFEIFAFDNGWDDESEIRTRIVRAFDEIVDISGLSDDEAAQAINSRKIDILVNLNGYFGLQRSAVFARKPSPVQVNYLGFPATLGAPYIDYIVADKYVVPMEARDHYVEKVVHLPGCYQVNDSRRRIAKLVPSRVTVGLPEDAFVFCCFNNNYKLGPKMFDIWMRLLNTIEHSVLWLLEDNAAAARNLRREASKRGIAPERIVFAPRMPLDEHLARHALADLFLDTLPYNAHTTASDALWAGLPVLTCTGTSFPGRVATSLLHAVDCPELITASLEEYENMALELARSPDKLLAIRQRLQAHGHAARLFDTQTFTRHLETAYEEMWRRCQAGLQPAYIDVTSLQTQAANRDSE